MKYLLIATLFLAGCSTVTPVKRTFPAVPEKLLVSCPELKEVDPKTTKLSEVVTVVTENYGAYQECAITTESWIDWYSTQKKIFEEVK
jgi:hypothetical protein